jgi:hypothetical protein
MAGSSMELTKTAAQAAVDVLSDEQSIGILTFNDSSPGTSRCGTSGGIATSSGRRSRRSDRAGTR